MSTENKLIALLETIESKITSETNIVWTKYDTIDELFEDLKKIKIGVYNQNPEAMENLKSLFAPTGSFQEMSIDNGWGDEFIKLSDHFDSIISNSKRK